MTESYLHGRTSKEATKTADSLKKKGRKMIRIDSKTVIFVKQEMDEEEAKASYRNRLDKFNMAPTKWKL